MPLWGAGLFGGLLALIGTAPGAVFLSEFLILRGAVQQQAWAVFWVLLAGLAVVFVAVLRQAVGVCQGPMADKPVAPAPAGVAPAPKSQL